MRIVIRTSKWAIWARRFGSFALPLTVLPVLLHRSRLIESDAFAASEVFAMAVAVLAVILALGAIVRLWVSGDRGWGRAITGGLLGLLCLAPAAYLLALYLRYPPANDVSTDPIDPPVLLFAEPSNPGGADTRHAAIESYPNVQTRSYPLAAAQVFALVDALARERNWDVRLRRQPQSAFDDGQLNAIAMTLFGWRDEVSIRVSGAFEATSVDMRSASLSALHEPGANGIRVDSLLAALDAAVTVTLRDTSGTSPPVPETGSVPVPAPAPLPN